MPGRTGLLTVGDPAIDVELKPNARARRLTLRLSATSGKATLTVPRGTPRRAAEQFLQSQVGWLRARIAEQPARVVPTFGTRIPFEGRPLTLTPGTGRVLRLEGDVLYVPGRADLVSSKLRGFMRHHARERLSAASERHAATVNKSVGTITLRDTRSRWGSCTTQGKLMYSWRLIMAPPDVLDYVAAHEIAHLVEMNHSAAFWQVVAGLMPHYQAPRNWLRTQGAALHTIAF